MEPKKKSKFSPEIVGAADGNIRRSIIPVWWVVRGRTTTHKTLFLLADMVSVRRSYVICQRQHHPGNDTFMAPSVCRAILFLNAQTFYFWDVQ